MPWKLNPFTGDMDYYGTVSFITSSPPADMCQVNNLYVNPATNKLIIKWDDIPGGNSDALKSDPPQGMYRVVNLYVNPSTGRLIVKYSTEIQ